MLLFVSRTLDAETCSNKEFKMTDIEDDDFVTMIPKVKNHGRTKDKRNIKPNAAETRYHDHVGGLGCLICQRPPSIHHIISDGFKRLTKDHMLVTPLCWDHHQGNEGYHGLGSHALFYARYGIDLYAEAKRIRSEYENG